MELTKQDNQMAKGLAIIGMVMLHLFCRLGDLPYEPVIWIHKVPLIYYFGLFGDLCVPVYCFCSGYAQMLMTENGKGTKYRIKKLLKFLENFWVVVVIFSIVGLIFDSTGAVPGSWKKFWGNIFLYGLSYNGAWWFVVTYVFLVLTTPMLAWITHKIKMVPLLILSGCVYSVSYILSSKISIDISNPVFSWIWRQTLLFGTSQFSFMVGMIFYKYRIMTKLRRFFAERNILQNVLCSMLLIFVFVGHGIIQTVAIAPITGLVALTCFYLWKKPAWIQKFMLFWGKHSTNIWLVHMFFYLIIFRGLVFKAKYPLFIFVFMMSLCIGCSYFIMWILKNAQKNMQKYVANAKR